MNHVRAVMVSVMKATIGMAVGILAAVSIPLLLVGALGCVLLMVAEWLDTES